MSRYIVRDPVIVNGIRRQRGDVLEGADAVAVAASPMLQHRCVKDSVSSPAAPQPAAQPAPQAAPKASEVKP
ncbi:MAG TPA: hypothetical protein VFN49_03740 [Candidatus Aquilonibacter sp.]|nr:hypothetical protein [Candidatus Aquilonibacter sp.]